MYLLRPSIGGFWGKWPWVGILAADFVLQNSEKFLGPEFLFAYFSVFCFLAKKRLSKQNPNKN